MPTIYNYAFGIILFLLTVFATQMTFKFVIKPLWIIRYYKKQGFHTYFYPFLGTTKRSWAYEAKARDSLGYYRELARQQPDLRYEVANSGARVSMILFDPKLIKEFYTNNSFYQKIPTIKSIQTIMGNGLVLSEGNVWKSHRKVISSVFHFEFLKQNIPLMVSTTQEFFKELAQTSRKNVSIMDEVQRITGEIVGRIFFGENLNNYQFKGQPLTLHLAELLSGTFLLVKDKLTFILFVSGFDPEWAPAYKHYMNDIRDFRVFCSKIVQDRKSASIESNDLLGALLKAQKNAKSEDTFTDQDIIDEFITFFVAGMDTTGHLVTMALYLLQKHPYYIDQLQPEIARLYDQTQPATIENLNQMDAMHALLKETLRFYAPAPTIVPRLALADHEIMGVKVKKGMSVRPGPAFNFANDKYFADSAKFAPERWLTKQQSEIDPYVFIPFSAGHRNCIGQHLSILESKIVISEFLKRFTIQDCSRGL